MRCATCGPQSRSRPVSSHNSRRAAASIALARIDRAARRAPERRPIVRGEAQQQHAALRIHEQDAGGGAGSRSRLARCAGADRQRVDAGGEQIGERLIDQPLACDAGEAGERGALDLDA